MKREIFLNLRIFYLFDLDPQLWRAMLVFIAIRLENKKSIKNAISSLFFV